MKDLKLVFISDTHSLHKNDKIIIPEGDFIIHCGDVSVNGKKDQILDFCDWFGDLPHAHKIMIPGNHDFLFEKEYDVSKNITDSRGINLLIDSGIKIEGINFWGSPITPWFHSWAFNRFRGSSIEYHWNKIPDDTDILITHGPPAYLKNNLCRVLGGEDVGCEDLYKAIKRIKPKINCFGHIHEGYGTYSDEETFYINCSILNRNYVPQNDPISVTYREGKFYLD
jgi:Icc-related predicted phosphoesterase